MKAAHRTKYTLLIGVMLMSALMATAGFSSPAGNSYYEIAEVHDIAAAWAGNPVRFDIKNRDGRLFVAFYDPERWLTVGTANRDDMKWKFVKIDEQVAIDSHNYVTIAIDSEGYIHMSANMHVDSLNYWRTTRPLDIKSFERLDKMTGQREDRCTYPKFFTNPDGRLMFKYRDGHSGSGSELVNIYDTRTKSWERFLAEPLIDGRGDRNAYQAGPQKGPDGLFHLAWCWRETFGCETNHKVCYARSEDLVNWTDSQGNPVQLPITYETAEIVDPVGMQGGLLNSIAISFDDRNRVVLNYIKFDQDGHTQTWGARLEEQGWRIYQITDWLGRWDFSGGGSIPRFLRRGTLGNYSEPIGLGMVFSHEWLYGDMRAYVCSLDPGTLRPDSEAIQLFPSELNQVKSPLPGIQVNLAGGGSTKLRWETFGSARDVGVLNASEVPKDHMLQLVLLEPAEPEQLGPYQPPHDRLASWQKFFERLDFDHLPVSPPPEDAGQREYQAAAGRLKDFLASREYVPSSNSLDEMDPVPVKYPISENTLDFYHHRFNFNGLDRLLPHDIEVWQPFKPELLDNWQHVSPTIVTSEAADQSELEKVSSLAAWYAHLNRLPHLSAYVRAYEQTGGLQWARRWIHDLGDWSFDNPVPDKPQLWGPWALSLAISRLEGPLLESMDMAASPEISDLEFFVLLKTLTGHCDYMAGVLEQKDFGQRHTRARAARIIQRTSQRYPFLDRTGRWNDLAWQERIRRD